MDRSIRDYLSSGGEISYNQIKERFGEPKQIVSTYVEEMETGELLRDLRARKKVVGVVLAMVAVIVTLWVGVLTVIYTYNQNVTNGFYSVEIVERDELQE